VLRNLFNKKRTVLVLGAVAVLAVAGVAVAYWTTSGSGSGSGAVASSNGAITLHGAISGELAPGGSAPVSFTADNANSSSEQVGTIHAVVSIDEAHANAGCEASDFTLADGGTISMADTAANQDACKGATISLALTS
jgi:hypothetical protein